MANYNPHNFNLGQFMNDLYQLPDLDAQFKFLGDQFEVIKFLGDQFEVINSYSLMLEKELQKVSALVMTLQIPPAPGALNAPLTSGTSSHPGPRAALVAKEVISPAIEAMRSKSATPSKVPAPVANRPLSSTSLYTSNLFQTDSANTSSSFNPQGQFRYSFPLEDETASKRLLD